MRTPKRTVWRIIIRRLQSDCDWWAGFPGLEYGRTDIDRLALECVAFMECYWKSEGLTRWEPDAAATRIMNAAACRLAGTCDIFCRAGHSEDCTDAANARVLAEFNA